jgi:hypothetical protein
MTKYKSDHQCTIMINQKWKLLYKIGSGSFGEAYEAITRKK